MFLGLASREGKTVLPPALLLLPLVNEVGEAGCAEMKAFIRVEAKGGVKEPMKEKGGSVYDSSACSLPPVAVRSGSAGHRSSEVSGPSASAFPGAHSWGPPTVDGAFALGGPRRRGQGT